MPIPIKKGCVKYKIIILAQSTSEMINASQLTQPEENKLYPVRNTVCLF